MNGFRQRATRQVRDLLAQQVRGRVAGPDAEQRAQRIWGKRGERRFDHDDPIWKVHSDASMFIGGLRALLLQSLHPLAMAGVAGHSGFRGDPWGRLQRTSHFIAETTFATVEDADRAVRIVRAVHKTVVGTTADGTPYAASDPHLLTWVHVAEIDSFLETYQRFGAARLDAADQDRYVEQAAHTALALGVPDPPRTSADLRDALESYRPELRATPEALDVARFLLLTPPLPVPLRPAYGLLAAAAAGSLPPWAGRMLRIPVIGAVTPAMTYPLGKAAASAIRWVMRPTAPHDRISPDDHINAG